MNEFFHHLKEVRKRPEMFVGSAEEGVMLERLQAYMHGFETGYNAGTKANHEWNRKFNDFVDRQGISGALVVGVTGVVTTLREYFFFVDAFEKEVQGESK